MIGGGISRSLSACVPIGWSSATLFLLLVYDGTELAGTMHLLAFYSVLRESISRWESFLVRKRHKGVLEVSLRRRVRGIQSYS